jgi:preprotein translocase subunit SecE
VARDRQRSKARQRARAAGQQPPRKRRSSRARDIGLDDSTPEESGLPAETTPDELEQAFPNVEEAQFAETGGVSAEPGDELTDEEFDRAQDEVEIPADLIVESTRRRSGEVELDQHGEPKERGRLITFIRACIDELSRVQWPDRKHVFQATAVVLGFVLIAGGWLGLMDAIWQPLINAIL